jgi:Neuraminidase (sialidase)
MVEIFGINEFNNALPTAKNGTALFQHVGIQYGEHCWAWVMPNNSVRILVRSSIDNTGKSGGTGEDSIRMYVEFSNDGGKTWNLSSKGMDTYTTRVKGWQERLQTKVIALFQSKVKPIAKVELMQNEVLRFSRSPKYPNRPMTFIDNNFNRWLSD